MFDVLAAAVIAMSHPQPLAPATPVAVEEDSPLWDCRTMGNLVCGPENAQGAPAGDYSEKVS